jgi:hypothetical protein
MEIKKKSKFGHKKTINTHIFNQFERKETKAEFSQEKKKVKILLGFVLVDGGSKDSPILWHINERVKFVTL